MENKLENPRHLEVGYVRRMANPFAMKAYYAVVGTVIGTPFRTATEARNHAVSVWQSMCDEYDAKVAEMANPSPVAAEEGRVVTE